VSRFHLLLDVLLVVVLYVSAAISEGLPIETFGDPALRGRK